MYALHCLDIGLTPRINGVTLWHLCYTDILPHGPQGNMDYVWNLVQQLYRERDTSSQFGFLGLASFTNPKSPASDWPELTGKGAQNRHLLPVLLSIWSQYSRESIPLPRKPFLKIEAVLILMLSNIIHKHLVNPRHSNHKNSYTNKDN